MCAFGKSAERSRVEAVHGIVDVRSRKRLAVNTDRNALDARERVTGEDDRRGVTPDKAIWNRLLHGHDRRRTVGDRKAARGQRRRARSAWHGGLQLHRVSLESERRRVEQHRRGRIAADREIDSPRLGRDCSGSSRIQQAHLHRQLRNRSVTRVMDRVRNELRGARGWGLIREHQRALQIRSSAGDDEWRLRRGEGGGALLRDSEESRVAANGAGSRIPVDGYRASGSREEIAKRLPRFGEYVVGGVDES